MAKKARIEKVHFNSLKRNGFPDMSQIFERIHLAERAIDIFYRSRENNVDLDPNVEKIITAHFQLCGKCQEKLGKKVTEATPQNQDLPL